MPDVPTGIALLSRRIQAIYALPDTPTFPPLNLPANVSAADVNALNVPNPDYQVQGMLQTQVVTASGELEDGVEIYFTIPGRAGLFTYRTPLTDTGEGGPVPTFTPDVAPVAELDTATGYNNGPGAIGARLAGRVNPAGAATTYRFQVWNLERTRIVVEGPRGDAGSGIGFVPVTLDVPLTTIATYYAWLLADSSFGEGVSKWVQFHIPAQVAV